MPKIVEYESNLAERGLNEAPLTTGLEYLERAGLRVVGMAREEGDAVDKLGGVAQGIYNEYEKHKSFEEISGSSATWAQLQGQQTEEWNDMLKQGTASDPDKVQSFNKKYSDLYTKWGDSFSTDAGKEYGLHRIEAAQEHWTNKMMADKSVVDGAKAVTDFHKELAAGSQQAYGDPTSSGLVISNLEASMELRIQQSNMTGEEAAKFREHSEDQIHQVAQAAGLAAADTGNADWRKMMPAEAMAKLTGHDVDFLNTRAREAQTRVTTQAKAQDELLTKQLQENFNTAVTTSQAQNITYGADGTPRVNPKAWDDLRKLQDQAAISQGRIKPEAAQNYERYLHTLTEDASKGIRAVTDPAVYTRLQQNITSADADVQIQTARVNHQLSDEDTRSLTALQKSIQDDPSMKAMVQDKNNFIKRMTPFVMPSAANGTGIVVPQESGRMYEFQRMVENTINNAHASGMSWSDANKTYLDPASPQYLGRAAIVSPYTTNTKEGLDQMMKNSLGDETVPSSPLNAPNLPAAAAVTGTPAPAAPLAGGVNQRKQGESPSDYLRRMNGGR